MLLQFEDLTCTCCVLCWPQADLVLLLELRKLSSIKEDSGFDPEALQSKMGRVVPVVARYLPDAAKAEAQLRSLTEVKDNKVVAALLGAFGFGATSEVRVVLPPLFCG
jgi:hypothetical protein